MIAVDDIGWFGARAFTDAAALNRREIDLAVIYERCQRRRKS